MLCLDLYMRLLNQICVSFKRNDGIHADNFKTNLCLIVLKMKMVLYNMLCLHLYIHNLLYYSETSKSNLCKFQKKCWNSCRQFQNKLVFDCP